MPALRRCQPWMPPALDAAGPGEAEAMTEKVISIVISKMIDRMISRLINVSRPPAGRAG